MSRNWSRKWNRVWTSEYYFYYFYFYYYFFLVLLYSNTYMAGNFSKTNITFYSRAIFLRGGEGRGCVGGACTYIMASFQQRRLLPFWPDSVSFHSPKRVKLWTCLAPALSCLNFCFRPWTEHIEQPNIIITLWNPRSGKYSIREKQLDVIEAVNPDATRSLGTSLCLQTVTWLY